ncbi:MAG TPA: hypothetical protein VFA97_11615 [Gaiellaceae bacterium]|nr:hypothetical protein [Gaiellaceae bacterium]
MLGFAVATIGGPLALVAIYLPDAAAMRSAGLLVALGLVVYVCPLLVWLRYSEEIASAGGLAAFVEAAAGRRLALVQAAVWAFSYFLYLPYTITDIVYEMLAVVFPGIEPWRWVLEATLPVGFVALVLLGATTVLRVLLVSAVLQLVVLLAFGSVLLAHVGAPAHSFTTVPGTRALTHETAAVTLLLVCGSLPLFLGSEAAGGARTIRMALVVSAAVVAAYLLFAIFPMAAVPASLRGGDIPGYAAAGAYAGRWFAVVVGLGAVISVAGVIAAEYVALSRLLWAITGISIRRLLRWIAVPFVALDLLSLLSPDGFDENVLRPSLIALYLSQMIVFAVYPLYRRRRERLTILDVAIASVAFAVMAWGLYRGITAPVST